MVGQLMADSATEADGNISAAGLRSRGRVRASGPGNTVTPGAFVSNLAAYEHTSSLGPQLP